MNTLTKTLAVYASHLVALFIIVGTTNLAHAQDSYKASPSGHTNLDLDLTDRAHKGYAFIKQIFDRDREIPFATVSLRNTPAWETPDNWTWEVANPNDNQLKNELTFKWYGQAACPSELTQFTLNGPGGYQVQNPLKNPVAGYFNYQSFDHQNIKNICVNWATNNNCDPLEPGCQLYEDFNLVGGVSPTASDLLNLSAKCANGTSINKPYAPVMTLRCDRSGRY